MNANQLVRAIIPDEPWAIAGMWTAGCNMLAGGAKREGGKSGFVISAGIHVAADRPFLGRWPVAHGDVYLIAYEDTLATIQRRIKLQCEKLEIPVVPKRLEIVTDFPKIDDGGLKVLEKLFVDYGNEATGGPLKLVIIDDLRHFGPMVVSYNKDNKTIETIDKLGRKYGVSIVVLLHKNKGKARGGQWSSQDQIQGSGVGAARTTAMLTRDEGETEGVLILGGKGVPDSTVPMTFDGESGLWTIMTTEYEATTALQIAIVAYVKKHPGQTAPEIARAMDRDYDATRQILHQLSSSEPSAIKRETARFYLVPSIAESFSPQLDLSGDAVKEAKAWGKVESV
jgi:hypothetical protein